MKPLALILLTSSLASAVQAAELAGLTMEEKARTASFAFKVELLLGCKEPLSVPTGDTPVVSAEFVKSWLREDIDGLGQSEEGKAQRERMEAFLDDLGFLFRKETPAKWKGKTVEEIAKALIADIRGIARAAGVTLQCDKEASRNNATDRVKK